MSYKENPLIIIERKIDNPRIQVKYPEVQGLLDSETQRKINEKIQDVVYKTIWNQGFEKDHRLTVKGSSLVTLNQRQVLSILFKLHFSVAETSTALSKVKSLTFNLQTGNIYKFEELFKHDSDYRSRIHKMVKRQIVERNIPLLKKFKSIENDQKFYLSVDALVIYFPHNEYTPESFDILEFKIPYGFLQDIAYEKGPLKF
jgi:Protein of unknown function (DUF3298)